ncbi:hypothetical protein A3F66_01605 [candidate division TM6 bacterium RIFCSPHIGHO2_12_FULL_32_22]|nr:MAG: hypothetical protein A3F66_01605 [candidate division TM6 bacterium RIFCSPHIGHO2_12_FULL_32_22]
MKKTLFLLLILTAVSIKSAAGQACQWGGSVGSDRPCPKGYSCYSQTYATEQLHGGVTQYKGTCYKSRPAYYVYSEGPGKDNKVQYPGY